MKSVVFAVAAAAFVSCVIVFVNAGLIASWFHLLPHSVLNCVHECNFNDWCSESDKENYQRVNWFCIIFQNSTGGTRGPYNEAIDNIANQAGNISIENVNKRMASQSDIEATLNNIIDFPTYYVRLFEESPEQMAEIGQGILEGLAEGDNVPESLQLATNNAVSGLQYAFADDISKVLNGKSNQMKTEQTPDYNNYAFNSIYFQLQSIIHAQIT